MAIQYKECPHGYPDPHHCPDCLEREIGAGNKDRNILIEGLREVILCAVRGDLFGAQSAAEKALVLVGVEP